MNTGIVEMIITVLGCLAVFIFAIEMLSDGLQRAAGDRIKRIIDMCTANYVVAVLAGFLMCVILQSSSACIILIIGFVNAGLIRLPEALCVVFGANIGTTLTAHVVAFDIGVYSWIFVFAGFVIMFFIKGNEHAKNIGEILFGGGLIFASLHIMSDTMITMLDSQWFTNGIKDGIDNGFIGIFLGMCATALVQSSSAVVAVVQQFAQVLSTDSSVEIIKFLPLIFGCNIGTTFTALLASIKATSNGKRTAIFHLCFNIFASVVSLLTITFVVKYGFSIPMITDNTDVPKAIANAHTIFNITGFVILFPFVGKISKILKKIRFSKESESQEVRFLYIQKENKMQPIVANMMCTQELMRCSKMVVDMFAETKKFFLRGNEKYAKNVVEEYRTVEILLDEIVSYISKNLYYEGYSQNRKYSIQMLYEIADEIKNTGKNCVNICQLCKTQIDEYIEFAEEDEKNVLKCFDKLRKLMIQTFSAIEEEDFIKAEKNKQEKSELECIINTFRVENLQRVKENDEDGSGLIIFSDILDNMERIASNCNSVSEEILKTEKI